VYVRDEFQAEYTISDKKEGNSEKYGILSIDINIKQISNNKLVIILPRNLYRIKLASRTIASSILLYASGVTTVNAPASRANGIDR
jgi:hypothetical protein